MPRKHSYLQVYSDEDGNAYLIFVPFPGWRMDFELDDETLKRLRDEINNELASRES